MRYLSATAGRKGTLITRRAARGTIRAHFAVGLRLLLLLVVTVQLALAQTVSFKPLLLPIEIDWSPSRGLSVRVLGPKVITPVGEVSLSFSADDLAQWSGRADGKKLLAIVVGKKTYLYELGHENVRLQLPKNTEGHVQLEYKDGNIWVLIPHPEDLAATPKTLDHRGARAVHLRVGDFSLHDQEHFSLTLERNVEGTGDFSANWNAGVLAAYRVRHLGPQSLDSVLSVPALTPVENERPRIPWPWELNRPQPPKWRSSEQAIVGHSYGIALGPSGPYAVVQILRAGFSDSDGEVLLIGRYKFNPDGRPVF